MRPHGVTVRYRLQSRLKSEDIAYWSPRRETRRCSKRDGNSVAVSGVKASENIRRPRVPAAQNLVPSQTIKCTTAGFGILVHGAATSRPQPEPASCIGHLRPGGKWCAAGYQRRRAYAHAQPRLASRRARLRHPTDNTVQPLQSYRAAACSANRWISVNLSFSINAEGAIQEPPIATTLGSFRYFDARLASMPPVGHSLMDGSGPAKD
jgi:hypothetical protein